MQLVVVYVPMYYHYGRNFETLTKKYVALFSPSKKVKHESIGKKSYLGVWIGKTTIILEINWETGCDCCWFKKAKVVHDFGTISKIPVIVLCSSMLSFPVSIFMYICIVGEFFLGFWMSALIPTHFIFSPIGCACAGPRSRPPVAVTSSLAQSSSAQPRAVQRRASHSHFRLKVQFSKAA